MSRIAIRIFLAVWITFFVVITAFTVVVEVLRSSESAQDADPFQLRQIRQHARQMETVYARRGVQGLQRLIQDIQDRRSVEIFLLDDQGLDTLGRPLPVAVQRFAQQQRNATSPQMQLVDKRLLVGPLAFADPALPVSIVLWLPPGASDIPPAARWWQGRYAWLQLVLGLVVSGLVSWGLALSLTRPLNRLELAARRLAAGQFDVQDIQAVAKRKDAIGWLAQEFSDMALRLQAALQAQQRLLRDVSHELRSPLARLQVAIGLAARQEGADRQQSLARMELECERLNTLIGEVLKLSRAATVDAGHERRVLDVVALLQGLVADAQFEAQAQHKAVCLRAPAAASVWGVPTLLASAVENVVRNAIHYTAANSTVDVVVEVVAGQVRICVADVGPGVPQAELDKIFIPFYRVSEARERDTGGSGTGVGLAIASQVIAAHGGTIRAYNRPSGGLEVEMVLPVAA